MARMMEIVTDSKKEGILKTTTGITIGKCTIKLLSQTYMKIFFQEILTDTKKYLDFSVYNINTIYQKKEEQFIFETKNSSSDILEEWLIIGIIKTHSISQYLLLYFWLDITKLMKIKSSSMKLVESSFQLKRTLTLRYKI